MFALQYIVVSLICMGLSLLYITLFTVIERLDQRDRRRQEKQDAAIALARWLGIAYKEAWDRIIDDPITN